MGIVETSESQIVGLAKAKGFLSQVLFSIGHTREHIRHDGTIGSGPDKDAVRGRNEACDLMFDFVWQLNDELIDNQ